MAQVATKIAANLYVTPGCPKAEDQYDSRHLWIVRHRSLSDTYSTVQCLLCQEVAYFDG